MRLANLIWLVIFLGACSSTRPEDKITCEVKTVPVPVPTPVEPPVELATEMLLEWPVAIFPADPAAVVAFDAENQTKLEIVLIALTSRTRAWRLLYDAEGIDD